MYIDSVCAMINSWHAMVSGRTRLFVARPACCTWVRVLYKFVLVVVFVAASNGCVHRLTAAVVTVMQSKSRSCAACNAKQLLMRVSRNRGRYVIVVGLALH